MTGGDSTKSTHHVWTPEEDSLLVQSLLQLRDDGTLVADNGFKAGGLKKLQRMIEEKSPGCGILAVPHIQSRLKTLKTSWQVIYDMLYGSNTSGFGWDPDKQCVTADKEVWDEYVKSHKKAAHFKNKPFPLFDALCSIFGKDRAIGKGSLSSNDVHEVEAYTEFDTIAANVDEDTVDIGLEMDPSITFSDHPSENTNVGTSKSKKRKRTSQDRDEFLTEALKEMLAATSQDIKDSSAQLGARLDKLAREAMLDARREALYDELLKVEDLTDNERTDAYLKMIGDDKILVGFPNLPDKAKAAVVRKILYA
ncbi:uncharacterized protein At2g29880-like [Prosopis cineraria]|uniref:uncharacterized protein At2g29880-like n=1 Tax=Prosopis cineraria TaxID=364024 RepID=UPI00240FA48F|nr:uncharacterized protein At2g29880-like [Prosopis cineraria]